MNPIRKAGNQEGRRGNESRTQKPKIQQLRSPFFLVSGLPHILILFSVPIFLIHSCFAADVVIGSKKFTESYVLGEIAKRTLTDAGIRCMSSLNAEEMRTLIELLNHVRAGLH